MALHRGWMVLFSVGLFGCQLVEVTASSRSYLGPSQSGAVTRRAARDTALEATRLFEVRGYALVDQQVDTPQGELLLRFARHNPPLTVLAAESGHPDDVGSMFYVWVTPTATGSTISLLGKPTVGGVEPCTRDGVALACSHVSVDDYVARNELSGRPEVEVARGVLSQLALEGYAVGPLPASTPAPTSNRAFSAAMSACQARRREVMKQVLATPDKAEKRRLFDAAPTC